MLEPNLVPAQWVRSAPVVAGGNCWFRPLCASSPVVVSGRSRCSARWMDPSYPVVGVGCWNGGVRVRRRHLRSDREPAPAKRSGRVSSRRNPSNDQVSLVVDFSIPLPRRGAGAYIVGVVGHPYLTTLLPLWLTMPSYTSTTPAVLAVGRTTAGAPILAFDQLPASISYVGGPVVRGREDVAARSSFAISDWNFHHVEFRWGSLIDFF
ncbi:hypothetical protein B296_00059009 [Ensete ventricosum]|uniref:Uncharacterized protein n=1 Tax=Ensete ventricosum TaxID=4639 RepID=A0A426XDU6_ENSVE|nr:hypothetical protein B296_00059009 [Ensete ventricosum]